MILQTHSELIAAVKKYGCYFMSLLFLANKHGGVDLDPRRIMQLYSDAIGRQLMDESCYIKDPGGILFLAGLRATYSQRHDPPDYLCDSDEIEILKFERPREPEGTWKHFVVGDGRGHVAYDPFGCSKTVAEGVLKTKRVFELARSRVVEDE